MANASIQLVEFLGAPKAVSGNQFTWPLTIIAIGTSIDSNVFVYQLRGSPFDPIQGDIFSCVASPSQINELPASASAAVSMSTPFYRQSTMTVICRSPDEANYIWQQVQADINDLINNFNATTSLVPVNIVNISGSGSTPSTSSWFPLVTYPAGAIAQQPNGSTSITMPVPTSAGWLPVSMAPYSPVPTGAILYYNVNMQSALKALFPLPTPYSSHLLLQDNVPLTYGLQWTLDANTIWWLNSNPGNNPLSGPPSYPWAPDYQNSTIVGSPTTLTLII
jgi:hypothetical protein